MLNILLIIKSWEKLGKYRQLIPGFSLGMPCPNVIEGSMFSLFKLDDKVGESIGRNCKRA